jgi:type IV secretory pathway VirJ component
VIPLLLSLALASSAVAAPSPSPLIELKVRVPFAGSATLYLPPKPPKPPKPPQPPSRAILFLSGDGGWNLGVVEMARRAARESGAAVAGLSLPAYLKAARGEKVPCWCPACDLEEIGKSIEKQAGFDRPSPPILLGYSSGATLVYAALAGGPPETFAGGMSLGFCPDLEGSPSICRHAGFRPAYDAAKHRLDFSPTRLERPWIVLQGNVDKVCSAAATEQFARAVEGATLARLDGVGHGYGNEKRWGAAFDDGLRTLMAAATAAEPLHAADAGVLNERSILNERAGDAAAGEPAAGSSEPAAGQRAGASAAPAGARELPAVDTEGLQAALEKLDLPLMLKLTERPRAYLLFISGDGGWSSLDRNLTSRLAKDHVDTVGISALQYFWKEKPAERVAADLKRILDLLRPKNRPILFGGYSFGAEVAPFLVNRPELSAPKLAAAPAREAAAAPREAADPVFAGLVLVAPGPFATWEVSPLDWFRKQEKPSPDKVKPQIEALGGLPTLCVYGADDRESACSGLTAAGGRVVRALGGGHHFGGDYDVIADEVARFVVKTLDGGVLSSGSAPTPEARHP